MKNILNYIRHVPKQTLVILAGLMILAVPAAIAMASWGPDRPTFTIANPADYITFNSITDNPDEGDERAFFRTKDAANTNKGGFTDKMEVEDGQELLLRAYVHNNAAANLNLVAENTRVRFLVPSGTDTNLRSIAYVSSPDALPQVVSDTADYYADKAFSLEYVAGSAVQYTNAVTSGIKLSDDIVTQSGAKIGYKTADGNVQGCFQYSSIVTIKVKVKMPDLEITKTVKKSGETSWSDNLAGIKPGDSLTYRLKMTNTGSGDLTELNVGDNLPPLVTYVKDSATAYDGSTPNGRKIGNNLTTGGTTLTPTYGPDAVIYILFEATVDQMPEQCGKVTLTNVGVAGAKWLNNVQDKATVEVETGRECEKDPQVLTCDLLTKNRISTNSWKFTANATAKNGATITGYDFNVDGDSKQNSSSNMFNFATNDPGTYTVQVWVNGKVDGKNVSKTSADCKKTVTVEEIPDQPIYECKSLTAVQDASNRLQFAFTTKVNNSADVSVNKYIYDFGDGSDKFSTDQSKVTKVYKDYGKYTVSVEVLFNVGDGQKSDVCSTTVEVLKTPPVTPPVTPPTTPPATQLPNTGPAEILAGVSGLFGAGALSYGAMSLRTSRNGLRDEILGKKKK